MLLSNAEEIPTEEIFGNRYPRRQNAENQNRATYLHGVCLGWRLAFHHRISTPGFLERRTRDRAVAVLSGSPPQLTGAVRAVVGEVGNEGTGLCGNCLVPGAWCLA